MTSKHLSKPLTKTVRKMQSISENLYSPDKVHPVANNENKKIMLN